MRQEVRGAGGRAAAAGARRGERDHRHPPHRSRLQRGISSTKSERKGDEGQINGIKTIVRTEGKELSPIWTK